MTDQIILESIHHGVSAISSAQGVLSWPSLQGEAEGFLQGATWLLGKHEHRCGKTRYNAFSEEPNFAARTVNIVRMTWFKEISQRCSLRKELREFSSNKKM